jgi:hypothetical protein
MIRVRVTTAFPTWPLARQTPGGQGLWGDHQFLIDREADRCDYWIVYEGLMREESCVVPAGNLIFVTGEPPPVRSYAPEFLAQFRVILTAHPDLGHPGAVFSQQGLPWHAGVRRAAGQGGSVPGADVARFGYDDFRAMEAVAKPRDLSVVCAAKATTPGHRQRIRFVRALKSHFGERLEWFGRGFNDVEDKWDAVAPYRFHLALENCRVRDYWTEKLADAYLGFAFPVYFGCPNLEDYFPGDSFASVDLADPAGAIARVERLLAEGITPDRSRALAEARGQVLERYNFFPAAAALLDSCAGGPPEPVTLRPEAAFVPRSSVWARLARRIRRTMAAT